MWGVPAVAGIGRFTVAELTAYVKTFVADCCAGVGGAEDIEVGGGADELGVALEQAGLGRVQSVCGDDACDEDEEG